MKNSPDDNYVKILEGLNDRDDVSGEMLSQVLQLLHILHAHYSKTHTHKIP